MKKEIIAVCIILAIIILINTICQKYLKIAVDNTDSRLEELALLTTKALEAKEDDDQKIETNILGISDAWDQYEKILSLYIEHEELEKIDTSIVLIKSYLDIANYEDAIPEMKECIFILNHIERKQKISIANLF